MSPAKPKISIITVALNDSDGMDKTLASILSQDYDPIELIIIDGGSTDGTLGVIKKYENRISWWISEPDYGPYDAMNKGLNRTTGEWVCFMNAGDTFYNSHTISELFLSDPGDAEVIYGDTVFDYSVFKIHRKPRSHRDFWKGMAFCHQSVIFRTSLIKEKGYDLTYKLGADFELIYRLFAEDKRFLYCSGPVAIHNTHGLSNRYMVKSSREHFLILMRHKRVTLKEWIYYHQLFGYLILIELAYKLLPDNLILKIIKLINRRHLVTVD